MRAVALHGLPAERGCPNRGLGRRPIRWGDPLRDRRGALNGRPEVRSCASQRGRRAGPRGAEAGTCSPRLALCRHRRSDASPAVAESAASDLLRGQRPRPPRRHLSGARLALYRPFERRPLLLHGQPKHPKTIHSNGWRQNEAWLRANVDPNARCVRTPGKFRYLMPLDEEMRRRVAPLALPYPKRPKGGPRPAPPARGRFDSDPAAPVSEPAHVG